MRRHIEPAAGGPPRFVDAGEEFRRSLGPVCDGLIERRPFTQAWSAGGPWRVGIQAQTGDDGL